MMLAASGANFGWRRTVPHAMGVSFGFPLMLFSFAMGLGKVFVAEPRIAGSLGWLGFAAMQWFAGASQWPTRRAPSAARPLSFVEAGAFRWKGGARERPRIPQLRLPQKRWMRVHASSRAASEVA